MWRNKDWDIPTIALNTKSYLALRRNLIDIYGSATMTSYETTLIEAGADAMLKAIQTELIICSSIFETMNMIETIFGASMFQED